MSFDLPSLAASGVTFARFRLSTAGNLGVGGVAIDGEVEDYAVNVAPPAVTQGVFAGAAVIASDSDSPSSVAAVDLDRDGDMDVISASNTSWYENDGNEQFTRRPITPNDVCPSDLRPGRC